MMVIASKGNVTYYKDLYGNRASIKTNDSGGALLRINFTDGKKLSRFYRTKKNALNALNHFKGVY